MKFMRAEAMQNWMYSEKHPLWDRGQTRSRWSTLRRSHFSKVLLQGFVVFTVAMLLFVLHRFVRQRHEYSNQYLSTNGKRQFQDYTVSLRDRLNHRFNLKGCIFTNDYKDKCTEISNDMSTSLVHSFSSSFEKNVRSKFIDPPMDNDYYVLSPAMTVEGENLKIYTRVMLDRLRFRYAKNKTFPTNQFQTNYIYQETYDKNLNSISGSLLGIPAPIFPLDGDGPMDPRVFKYKGKTYIIILMFANVGKYLWKPYPFIWDTVSSTPFVADLNLTYIAKNPMEKNWTPIVVNESLYLIHSLDPLRIIKCNLDTNVEKMCDFVQDESAGSPAGFVFDRHAHTLRGGTPFLLYEWPYYISLAHSVVIFPKEGAPFGRVRRYEANLVVLRADLNFRVVYVSNALQFHSDLFKDLSMIYYEGQVLVENDFVYPVSILKETPDSILIGAHIKDHVSVLLRMRGLGRLMETIKVKGHVTGDRVQAMSVQQYVKRNFPQPKQ